MKKNVITIPNYCNGQIFHIDFDVDTVEFDSSKPLFLLNCDFFFKNRPLVFSVISFSFNYFLGIKLYDGSCIVSCHFRG